jgi:hypothetical protein
MFATYQTHLSNPCLPPTTHQAHANGTILELNNLWIKKDSSVSPNNLACYPNGWVHLAWSVLTFEGEVNDA